MKMLVHDGIGVWLAAPRLNADSSDFDMLNVEDASLDEPLGLAVQNSPSASSPSNVRARDSCR